MKSLFPSHTIFHADKSNRHVVPLTKHVILDAVRPEIPAEDARQSLQYVGQRRQMGQVRVATVGTSFPVLHRWAASWILLNPSIASAAALLVLSNESQESHCSAAGTSGAPRT